MINKIIGSTVFLSLFISSAVASNKFECNSNAYLFSSGGSANSVFSKISLKDGTVSTGTKFWDNHINAIGYNVIDDYIYGIEYVMIHGKRKFNVVKVDKNFKVEKISLTGQQQLPDSGGGAFALGDVSPEGEFYVSPLIVENNILGVYKMYVIDLDAKKIKKVIRVKNDDPNGPKLYAADYAFNPIDKQLYTVDTKTKKLIKINPKTGYFKSVGYVGDVAAKNSSVHSVIDFLIKMVIFIFIQRERSRYSR